ncbi:peptidyl-tRNA hydrolase Pth2 [Candidatus Woesearchaeota archaeon]|nr:peptidyl-tRNA hydrolase Pth2 [Candidatus Woesearchaeota archaeon]MBW3005333.1 peptidyl-tRNA hydrolase Pth2 [Candidatus Woesearchaeota archaeon]
MKEYKQVILIRKDLKLSKGKMSAQAAHASTDALLKSHKDDIKNWKDQGMKKVILGVENQEELLKLKVQAEDAGLVTVIIADAGRTELAPGTVTAVGIGPDDEDKIDRVTGHLKLIS